MGDETLQRGTWAGVANWPLEKGNLTTGYEPSKFPLCFQDQKLTEENFDILTNTISTLKKNP